MAEGVITGDLQRSTLDAGNVAFGFLEDFDLEFFVFAIAQIHALEDRRPVLRLSAARSGLYVKKTVVRIHRIGEHPAEFHGFDDAAQLGRILFDGNQRVVVFLGARHFEQFVGVAHVAVQCLQRHHDVFQHFAFTPDFLRALGIAPQRRILGQLDQLLEAAFFRIVVKDTSAAPPRVLPGLRGGWQWR